MHTHGVTVFSQWPLQHFFDYIFSFDSIVSNLQYPRECQGELWIIVRGDGLPCGGESWWGGIVVPDVHFLCQPWSLGKDEDHLILTGCCTMLQSLFRPYGPMA